MRCYTKSFNGFASMLTNEEANILSSMNEVLSVFPSKRRQLHTTRTWDFLGFPLTAPRAALESDVIIGILDTGIWPESKSFDDTGFGPPPSRWKGVCDSNHNFTCNNKIIGARYYHYNLTINIGQGEIASPRDSNGHGTHTSSTAAGIGVPHTNFSGLAEGTARGGAPSARIAVYKICWNRGMCHDTDILAAFDDAIADGVDIISISIGKPGETIDYFEDSIAIGSFHAMKKNILTSASAGNSGPNGSTVENYAPWMLTVAASTIDRKFAVQTQLGDGQEYQGLAINTVGLNGVMYPLIYGGDAPNTSAGVSPSNSSTCAIGTLNGELVKGKVVLCSEVRNGLGPRLAGAVGAIMKRDGPNDKADVFALPVAVLGSNDSMHVLNYVKKSSNPTASISKSREVIDPEAPYVASFSSRGPNRMNSNILKPDLTAPGVDILAAWKPLPGIDYVIISGTSMSCPHVSGAAAYVKSFNPNWSPAAIKSALMTTAHVMSPTKNVDAEFAYGAGELNPLSAVKPGLVYDADEKDYVKMLCAEGYSTKHLRAVTGDSSACTSATNGTVLGLNYPSFALLVNHGKSFSNFFQRTVTNVGKSNSIYKATVNAPSSIKISVEPDILSFESLLEKKSFVLKIEGDAQKSILSASLTWSDGVYNVRSPIIVYTKKN